VDIDSQKNVAYGLFTGGVSITLPSASSLNKHSQKNSIVLHTVIVITAKY